MLWIVQPLVGAALVVVALYDLASTVIGASRGAGPISGRVAAGIWHLLLKIHRRGEGHPVMLRRSGPSILLVIIVLWVTMLIIGWAMIFGGSNSLLQVDTDEPLAFLGKVYFAAATILGRGSSNARPQGDFWDFMEALSGLTGIALLSLSIAYVIPVVQAVVTKRKVALYISSLGETPEKILDHAWNGRDLADLNLHIIALTPMVADLAERHLAYPVVHYFHSSEQSTAIGPAIVSLDEVLTINARVVDTEHRVSDSATIPLRQAITHFLDTLEFGFIDPVDEHVDIAAVDRLEEAGVPVVEELPEDPFSETADRRQLLRGYLEHDGWHMLDLLPRAGEEHETREHETEAAE
ncbi:MAG: hypothetical protein R3343_08010 [Nitriliruptorales bacterium]|nr:hypothetical protein [Nitriliruptorales bacterium]